MDKNLQTLELDKVLALLAEQTTCDDAKEAALALRPAADPGEIALLLDQTEDAFSMLARFGAPSFGGLHNVNGPLQRAAVGGCLNMTELLQVGDTPAGTAHSGRLARPFGGHKLVPEFLF